MQFWWIAVIASVTIGMVFSVSVLVIEAITPYGYTDQQAGLCASIIVVSGCFGGGKKEQQIASSCSISNVY
jgi:FLVCR family MFS transporter 7